ncbi:UNKNOWN [Stylonychia lemnae]|uniref:Uncharacterized protein n=1 Tax=Stylonychia lemnae TaxID=5949 RepID=A0A078AW13_STYLE|nr:UNKNOWN [Stylonychia lemnae]|eukprot:CDW85402.1 UNKNOWN [Stylonychia lemnae]
MITVTVDDVLDYYMVVINVCHLKLDLKPIFNVYSVKVDFIYLPIVLASIVRHIQIPYHFACLIVNQRDTNMLMTLNLEFAKIVETTVDHAILIMAAKCAYHRMSTKDGLIQLTQQSHKTFINARNVKTVNGALNANPQILEFARNVIHYSETIQFLQMMSLIVVLKKSHIRIPITAFRQHLQDQESAQCVMMAISLMSLIFARNCEETFVLDNGECKDCNSGKIAKASLNYYPQCSNCDSSGCLGCVNGFKDSSGNCVSKCPKGFYGYKDFSQRGKIANSICVECHEQCLESKSTLTLSIDIFVQPPPNIDFDATVQTGERDNPFMDIQDAITSMYERCADVIDTCTVTINLMKGTHWILRSTRKFYRPISIDSHSQNIKLTITPLYCNGDPDCYEDDTAQVIIKNKVRDRLNIPVGQGLTIKNVIIDSLDSMIDLDVQAPCLKLLEDCCQIDPITLKIQDVNTSTSYCSNEHIMITEECNIANGGSLIKFDISQETVLTRVLDRPPTLLIDGCQFKNFIFDFNTLIETNSYGGHIIIQNSKFERFSTCGAVLRNFRKFYQVNETMSFSILYNYKIRQNSYQKQIFDRLFEEDRAFVGHCLTDCESLTISKTNFTKFGIDIVANIDVNGEQIETTTLINPAFGMHRQGKILHLDNFNGPTNISENIFEYNILGYQSGCNILENEKSFKYDKDEDPDIIFQEEYPANDAYNSSFAQLKHLISIQNQLGSIQIRKNTFQGNSVIKGIINIDGTKNPEKIDPEVQDILIEENVFNQNFAYLSTIAIHIRRYFKSFDNYTLNDGYLPCGGVLINSNNFSNNFGCPLYGGSLIQMSCQAQETLDQFDQPKPLEITQNKFSHDEIMNLKDIVSQDFGSPNKNQFTLSNNNYFKNYGGYNEGMIDIRGMLWIQLKNESYIQNGENVQESTIALQKFKTSDNYIAYLYKNQTENTDSRMRLSKFFQPSWLPSEVIQDNFIYEQNLNATKGAFITIERFFGFVHFIDVDVSSFAGMLNSIYARTDLNLQRSYYLTNDIPVFAQTNTIIGFDQKSDLKGIIIIDKLQYQKAPNAGLIISTKFDRRTNAKTVQNCSFKNIISRAGGVFHIAKGNMGVLQFLNCNFINTESYTKGGIVSVNPSWNSQKLTEDGGLTTLAIHNCKFEYNFGVNEQLEDFHYYPYRSIYWSRSGYIAFINQISPINLEISNNIVTQFYKSHYYDIYENNQFIQAKYNEISVKQSDQKSYGTAIVIISMVGIQINSNNNLFIGCRYGYLGGIYHLSSAAVYFNDMYSAYINSFAFYGGMLYCEGCQQISIENTTYDNLQDSGGFAFIYGNRTAVKLSITDSSFTSVNSSQNINDTLKIAKLIDSLYDGGGVIFIQGPDLEIELGNNVFKKISTIKSGGLLFAQSTNELILTFQNQNIVNAFATEQGAVMYAESLQQVLTATFEDNVVLCKEEVNSDQIKSFLADQKRPGSESYHAFQFITFLDSTLTSKRNKISNCGITNYSSEGTQYIGSGGVYNLDGKKGFLTFEDSFSNYSNNSAYYGGVYQCGQCALNLNSNLYSNQVLIEDLGGLLFTVISSYEFSFLSNQVKFYDIYVDVDQQNYNDNDKLTNDNIYQLMYVKQINTVIIKDNTINGYLDLGVLKYLKDYKKEFRTILFNESIVYKFQGLISVEDTKITTLKSNVIQNISINNYGVVKISNCKSFSDENSIYENNTALNGAGMTLKQVNGNMTSNHFIGNSAQYGGSIQILDFTVIYMSDLKFQYSYSSNEAGCILIKKLNPSIQSGTLISLWYSEFSDSYAEKEGGVFRLEDKNLELDFQMNTVYRSGTSQSFLVGSGGVIFGAQYKQLSIINNVIKSSKAYEGIFITSTSKSSQINMENNLFYCQEYSKAKSKIYLNLNGGISKYKSAFSFQNLNTSYSTKNQFKYCYDSYSGGAISLFNSQLQDEGSTFQMNSAIFGGAVQVSLSNLTLNGTQFIENYGQDGGAISIDNLGYLNVIFLINQISVSIAYSVKIKLQKRGELQILLQNHTLSSAIQYSEEIKQLKTLLLMSQNLVKTYTRQVQTALKYNCRGGFIHAIMSSNLTVINSIFQYGYTLYGGSMYVSGGSMKVDKIPQAGGSIFCVDCGNFYITNIISSTFSNSYSQSAGGAVYLNNQFRVLFQANTLNSNYARTQGGGLYMDCLTPFDCKYNMLDTNKFWNNFANSSGGGIYWSDVQPTLVSGSSYEFKENKALIYADDIGSYPQKLVSLTQEQYQAQLLRSSGNQKLDSTRRLRDLQVSNSPTSSSQDSQRSGDALPTMYIGLADAMGQIVGTESSKKLDVSLKGTLSNGSNSMKYSATIAGTTTFYSINGVYALKDIVFTGAPGENYQLSFNSDGIDPDKPANKDSLNQSAQNSTAAVPEFDLKIGLRECQVGEKFTDAGACDQCPIEKSYSLVKMTEPGQCKTCPTGKAVCNGGSDIGPQPGYWRKNNVTSTFIKCFNFGACLGLVSPQNDPKGSCYTGYDGILCTDCDPGYSVTGSFQCGKCPEYAQNVFRIVAILIVGVVVIVFMIRSTLQGAADVKNITSVFQKILLNHIQLIVLTASFDFSWPQMVVNYFKTSETVGEASNQIFSIDCFLNEDKGYGLNDESSKNGQSAQKFGIRIFYIKLAMFGMLPFLLMLISSLFWFLLYHKSSDKEIRLTNCVDIDGDSRVKNDLEILCYTGEHNIWSMAVGLPSLIVWGLGIPLFAYILLLREHKSLDTLMTRQKYGFLYRGFKRRFYYWEIVITYRKIFLIFIQVFLVQQGVITQAMMVLLMLIFFMSINITKQPFQTKTLNELETLSLITSLLSIFCGVFFIVSVDSTDIESGQSTSDSQGKLIHKLNKYEMQLEAASVKEENEILREKYQDQMKQLSEMCDTGEILLNKRNLEKLLSHLSKDSLLKMIRRNKDSIDQSNISQQAQRIQRIKRTTQSQIEDSRILTQSVKQVGLRKKSNNKKCDYKQLQITSKEFAEKQTDCQSITQKHVKDKKKKSILKNSPKRILTQVDTEKSIILFNQLSNSRFNTESQRDDENIVLTDSGLMAEGEEGINHDFGNKSNHQPLYNQNQEDIIYSQMENEIAGSEYIPVKAKITKKKTGSQVQIKKENQIDQFIQKRKTQLAHQDNLQVVQKSKQRGPQKKKFKFLAESPREDNQYKKLRDEQLKSIDREINLKDEHFLTKEVDENPLKEKNYEVHPGKANKSFLSNSDEWECNQQAKNSSVEIQSRNTQSDLIINRNNQNKT